MIDDGGMGPQGDTTVSGPPIVIFSIHIGKDGTVITLQKQASGEGIQGSGAVDTEFYRITGNDAQGKRLELVFLRKLNECPTGDTYLPQRWAGQKLLFLLSRLNSTDNPAEARSLNAQITDLTRRFKIYSAY